MVSTTSPRRVVRPGDHEIPLEQIRLDGGTQVRESLDEAHIERLVEVYREGTLRDLPKLLLFCDCEHYWLADGFHRYEALVRLERSRAWCEVRAGSQREAQLYSKGANAQHGLPRSRADKRRSVMSMLLDPEWSTWGDRPISRACNVSHPYVIKLRAELAAQAAAEGGGNITTPEPPQPEGAEVTERDPESQSELELDLGPSLDELVEGMRSVLEEAYAGPDVPMHLPQVRVRLEARFGRQVSQLEWLKVVQAGAARDLWREQSQLAEGWLVGPVWYLPPAAAELERQAEGPTLDEHVSALHTMLEQWTAAGIKFAGVQPAQVRLEKNLGCKLTDEQWTAILQAGVERKLWQHDAVRGTVCLIPWDAGLNEHHISEAAQALIDLLVEADATRGAREMLLSKARETLAVRLPPKIELTDALWRATLEVGVKGRVLSHTTKYIWVLKDGKACATKPVPPTELEDLENDPHTDDTSEEDHQAPEEDPDRSATPDPDLEHDLILIRSALGQLENGAAGAPFRLETVRERFLALAELEQVSDERWEAAVVEGVDRLWWRWIGNTLRLVQLEGARAARAAPAAMPPDEPTPLPNGERAPLDAYYTPRHISLVCVRWLADRVLPTLPEPLHGNAPDTAVEPSVGDGSWVEAMHEILPSWTVDRVDIDPKVAGLGLDLREREDLLPADWLAPFQKQPHPQLTEYHPLRRWRWRLCIGNPPYGGDIVAWFERSLERADCVAYLLRDTITGAEKRLDWWLAHRPAWVAKVMPRPKWEGPGARPVGDQGDTVLVVWVRGVTETRWDWIDAREGA